MEIHYEKTPSVEERLALMYAKAAQVHRCRRHKTRQNRPELKGEPPVYHATVDVLVELWPVTRNVLQDKSLRNFKSH
ncbi:hypothetical protein NECAME_07071 [Necator americanus]|uniref:Uncharacterized protein n=1 Tax=Necator americanus TaxID=51031 RepID=W2TQT9_NECAM|nr:hypothetical protein NECAME_07071 [Necator americanus]ETN84044.1 hypothetical protein NECAME_07071 [Necator americanus]